MTSAFLTIILVFTNCVMAQDFGALDFKGNDFASPSPLMQTDNEEIADKSINLFGGFKLLPDSYGITIYIGETESQFRTVAEAEKYLKNARDNSVTLAIFYGHGAPGIMTIGNDGVASSNITGMLKNKMADNSAVHLFGCNTSAVPNNISLNPFKGLSYLARRIVYYQGARVSGASKEIAEEMWNEDMAQDISKTLKNSEICGLATYGLVPERLIGKEKIKPGIVLGEWECYKNSAKISSGKK